MIYKTILTLPSIYTDVLLKLLFEDLKDVWRWYPLGLQLGLPDADLKMIKNDYRRTEDMKFYMLSEWMKIDEQPSWSKLVRALVAINERHVARNIAVKYGKLCSLFYCTVYMYILYICRRTLSI